MSHAPQHGSLRRRIGRIIERGVVIGFTLYAVFAIVVIVAGHDRIVTCEGGGTTTVTVDGVRFFGRSDGMSFPTSRWSDTCPDVIADRFTYRWGTGDLVGETLEVALVESNMSLAAISERSSIPIPDGEGATEMMDPSRSRNPDMHRGLFVRSGHPGMYDCSVFEKNAMCHVRFTIKTRHGWIVAGTWRRLGGNRRAGPDLALEAIDEAIPIIRSMTSLPATS